MSEYKCNVYIYMHICIHVHICIFVRQDFFTAAKVAYS